MKPDDSLRSGYESTPYHDQSFREFDLARLLGFAELFALRDPTRPGRSLRVLDLGCASGVHLREQAARYPHVRFEGIDFSTAEIEMGQKAVRESGLKNIDLVQGDLRSFAVDSDAYDLVLCHGVFSWVPDDVKERIFLLARQALKPDGLAAIAYLTYPGWKQLEAFRELLMMRVSPDQSEAERIRESALLLRLLHASYEARATPSCMTSSARSTTPVTSCNLRSGLKNAGFAIWLKPTSEAWPRAIWPPPRNPFWIPSRRLFSRRSSGSTSR
jgi:SAM-dependent methyltransferase